MTKYPKIVLKKGKEESLKRRHPWIFSGAIARAEGNPEEGELVEVYDSEGDFIALGHCQIGSIAVRVLTFAQEEIDGEWWRARIAAAYRMREALGLTENSETTCYRLVHGEGDGLPGLIVDIYGAVAVVQCHSVGMFLSREHVCAALRDIYGGHLRAVYDKSSQTVPPDAELDAVDGYLWRSDDCGGEEQAPVLENGCRFAVNWERGQKTGFFIDQRDNRLLVKQYSQGRKVLNTFSYTGGFSVYALAGGAILVDSVDSSAPAVELAERNVRLNFGDDAFHRAIAADTMKYLADTEQGAYDLIILDPPAYAKHQKAVHNALQGYKRLNARAISKIAPGGVLFTFSCSQAISRDMFRMAVFSGAAIAGRNVRILHQLSQPADHPVNIYHPEGEYLKGLVLYVE